MTFRTHHAPVWQAWALLEEEQGDIPRARELFDRAAQVGPNEAPVWQAWALMEEMAGNANEADWLFQKAVEASQRSVNLVWLARAHSDWAKAYDHRGDSENALQHFQLALQANPQDGFVYAYLADITSRLGLTDQAKVNIALAERHLPKGRKAEKVRHIIAEARRRLREK